MATYVISDIHGMYNKFTELLNKIKLKDTDTLYILGDVLDRGPDPIKTLLKIMSMPNVICMLGNHEDMALDCLKFFMTTEITEQSLAGVSEEMLENLVTWQYNGSKTTIDGFRALDRAKQQEVIDFIEDMPEIEEISVAGQKYLLVHGGLGDFYPGKPIESYTIEELIWASAEYDIQYFDDTYVVTGHTPTQGIPGNLRPGYVYRQNNHIAIDCGAVRRSGRLAAIRLDDGKEFYTGD